MLTTSINNSGLDLSLAGNRLGSVSGITAANESLSVASLPNQKEVRESAFAKEASAEDQFFSDAQKDGAVGLKAVFPEGKNHENQDISLGHDDSAFSGQGQVSEEEDSSGKDIGKKPGYESSPAECETCKNRKYQDGSNEMVSYKSAAHISPESAGSAVRAHEGEHVSNAYKKAAQGNGKVLQASVSIHTSICPECGRTYVSGGETKTQIMYSDETNPYQQEAKASDASVLVGANSDQCV